VPVAPLDIMLCRFQTLLHHLLEAAPEHRQVREERGKRSSFNGKDINVGHSPDHQGAGNPLKESDLTKLAAFPTNLLNDLSEKGKASREKSDIQGSFSMPRTLYARPRGRHDHIPNSGGRGGGAGPCTLQSRLLCWGQRQ